jgi:diguanylate cyclase (GGDEF)-like protein
MTVENRGLRRQIESVHELGAASTNAVRDETPLRRFLALARGLVAFDRAVLWLEDDSDVGLSARAIYPEDSAWPDPHEAGANSLISRALRRSNTLIVADVSRDPRQQQSADPASWMLIPMMLNGKTIGVAQFVRSHSHPFSQSDARQLAVLVPQATIALENTRVRHMMHRYADMAVSDGLTGLLNHRRSQEILREELSRAMRYGRPLSILMMDVDFFKNFNDSFGHPQGDKLLQAIAKILRVTVRNVDHVGRYGGEEFIAILPETGHDDAFILAERIRTAVEAEPFATGTGSWVQKTVSIGVASYPDDSDSPDDLVLHADNALYEAKRTGKNRVLTAAK